MVELTKAVHHDQLHLRHSLEIVGRMEGSQRLLQQPVLKIVLKENGAVVQRRITESSSGDLVVLEFNLKKRKQTK